MSDKIINSGRGWRVMDLSEAYDYGATALARYDSSVAVCWHHKVKAERVIDASVPSVLDALAQQIADEGYAASSDPERDHKEAFNLRRDMLWAAAMIREKAEEARP